MGLLFDAREDPGLAILQFGNLEPTTREQSIYPRVSGHRDLSGLYRLFSIDSENSSRLLRGDSRMNRKSEIMKSERS
jgi:hypothetical protein